MINLTKIVKDKLLAIQGASLSVSSLASLQRTSPMRIKLFNIHLVYSIRMVIMSFFFFALFKSYNCAIHEETFILRLLILSNTLPFQFMKIIQNFDFTNDYIQQEWEKIKRRRWQGRSKQNSITNNFFFFLRFVLVWFWKLWGKKKIMTTENSKKKK